MTGLNTEQGGKIEFHYAFYGAVRVWYCPGHRALTFSQEHELGAKPVRPDMIMTNKGGREKFTDPIGRFFRESNILDYKSPRDGLTIKDFYKAQGYACIHQSMIEGKWAIDTVAVSMFRHTFPRQMFADLEKMGNTVETSYPGIYYVTGRVCVPVQVVITSQLPEGEYGVFKILAGGAKREDVIKFIEGVDATKNDGYAGDVEAILRVSMAANERLYQKLKEEGLMTGAVARIFKEEFAEARGEARAEGRSEGRAEAQQIIRERLIAGGIAPQDAARFVGLPL